MLTLPDTAYLVLTMFASVGDSQEFYSKPAESFDHALQFSFFCANLSFVVASFEGLSL